MARAARATTSTARSCCARASRAPGAGCRRSSRGCRCRPAPAWTAARSCCAAPARCCRSTAPRRSRRGPSKRASRRPPRPNRTSRCSSRSSWKAAGTRCRCSRRCGEASYHELRPTLGLSEGEGVAVHRGRTPDVAPAGGRPGAAARRRQGRGVPGDRLRPARREPLHEPPLLGGRRARHAVPLGLDGALPRRRRQPRQPAAGALAGLLARARARHDAACRSPRSPRRPTTTSGPTAWTNR